MGLTHLTRVFTTDVGDTCVNVFVGSRLISSLDPPQIVSNITLAHSHFQFPTRGLVCTDAYKWAWLQAR
jgi:hypothetical protein